MTSLDNSFEFLADLKDFRVCRLQVILNYFCCSGNLSVNVLKSTETMFVELQPIASAQTKIRCLILSISL